RLRPDELPGAQTLVEKTQPILAVPEHLDPIAALAAEEVQLAGEWVGVESGLHHCAQAVKAAAKISEARHQPDPHSVWWADHELVLLVAEESVDSHATSGS